MALLSILYQCGLEGKVGYTMYPDIAQRAIVLTMSSRATRLHTSLMLSEDLVYRDNDSVLPRIKRWVVEFKEELDAAEADMFQDNFKGE